MMSSVCRTIVFQQFPMIVDIHDLHVWGLTASRIIATCHVILPDLSSEAYDNLSESLNDFFHRKGIFWATIQPEFQSDESNRTDCMCLMKCSKFSNTNCDSFACCSDFSDEHSLQEVVDTVVGDH